MDINFLFLFLHWPKEVSLPKFGKSKTEPHTICKIIIIIIDYSFNLEPIDLISKAIKIPKFELKITHDAYTNIFNHLK